MARPCTGRAGDAHSALIAGACRRPILVRANVTYARDSGLLRRIYGYNDRPYNRRGRHNRDAFEA